MWGFFWILVLVSKEAFNLYLGAIQIICDSLGGRGGGVSKNVTQQFLLVISLGKVDKKWGGGVLKVSHII
jgi:hypothetical protein